jgi:hypothetical protein
MQRYYRVGEPWYVVGSLRRYEAMTNSQTRPTLLVTDLVSRGHWAIVARLTGLERLPGCASVPVMAHYDQCVPETARFS